MPGGGAERRQGRGEVAPAGPRLQEPGHPQEFEVTHQGLHPLPGREEIDPGGLGQGHEPGRLVRDPIGKLPPAGLGEEMGQRAFPRARQAHQVPGQALKGPLFPEAEAGWHGLQQIGSGKGLARGPHLKTPERPNQLKPPVAARDGPSRPAIL